MIDSQTGQPIVLARNAEVGQYYLTAGMYYKIKIISINGNPEEGYVSSVTVDSENESYRVTIAGDTTLIPFNERYHKVDGKSVKQLKSASTKRSPLLTNQTENKIMAKKESPRSKLINTYLSSLLESDTPDWNQLASDVIAAGCAEAGKKAAIISQARGKWASMHAKKVAVVE